MDSLLALRYSQMADSQNAILCPVGKVWRSLRLNHPGIELYQADESHPSYAGTYAAAMSFFVSFFGEDPRKSLFNGSLSTADAFVIREVAGAVVFDSLSYWNFELPYSLSAHFQYQDKGAGRVQFDYQSVGASDFLWYFGDGDSSIQAQPTHTYALPGIYTFRLIARHCHFSDTFQKELQVGNLAIAD